jgi:anti-sigma factor RsiW
MINSCDQIRLQMGFYLDDELHQGERDEFEAHLESCAHCRGVCEQEERLLKNVRASRPLYKAPPELCDWLVRNISISPEPITASYTLRERIQDVLKPGGSTKFEWRLSRLLALATVLMFIAFAGFLLIIRRESNRFPRPSDFALMAVETHLRRLRGQLPLEISSDSPEIISSWFAGKVPFRLQLPNYQESSRQEKLYHLEGARLVALNSDYAAYIAYKMKQSPITLVVTANSVAMPSGGEEIVSKGLKFHYDSINGLKVITWSDRGLTYALVSNLEERGQQSCLVCHAGTKDRDFIEGLKISKRLDQ